MKTISDKDYLNIMRFLELAAKAECRTLLTGSCRTNKDKNLIDKAFITARKLKRRHV